MNSNYGRAFRKLVTNTQKDLVAYERSHKLSAKSRYNMSQAMDALARARYSHIGPEQDAINAKAQKVLDFIAKQGIRGIAFGGGVPGLK